MKDIDWLRKLQNLREGEFHLSICCIFEKALSDKIIMPFANDPTTTSTFGISVMAFFGSCILCGCLYTFVRVVPFLPSQGRVGSSLSGIFSEVSHLRPHLDGVLWQMPFFCTVSKVSGGKKSNQKPTFAAFLSLFCSKPELESSSGTLEAVESKDKFFLHLLIFFFPSCVSYLFFFFFKLFLPLLQNHCKAVATVEEDLLQPFFLVFSLSDVSSSLHALARQWS